MELVKLSVAGLCSLLSLFFCENSNAQSLLVSDKYGVSEALLEGDYTRLKKLSHDHPDPLVRLYSQSAYLRMVFDFSDAATLASRCFQLAVNQQRPEQATMCALLELQSTFDAGRLLEWESQRSHIRDTLYNMFRSKYGRDTTIHYFEDFGNLEGAGAKDTSLALTRDVFLPFSSVKPTDWKLSTDNIIPMFLQVGVEGLNLWALPDTGSHTSLISNDVLGRIGHGKKSEVTIPKFRQLSSIDLGGVIINDAIASYAPSDNVPTVLGINILSRLPAVRFTNEGVYIFKESPLHECVDPLIIMSDLNSGAYKIKIPLKIDGVYSLAFLDTGSDSYVTRIGGPVSHSDTKQVESITTESGIVSREYFLSPAEVDFGSLEKPVKREIKIIPDGKSNYGYRVGRRALQDINVTIDFVRRRLCVTAAR